MAALVLFHAFSDDFRKRVAPPIPKFGIRLRHVRSHRAPVRSVIEFFERCGNLGVIAPGEAFNKKETFFTGLIGVAQILNQVKAKIARIVITEMAIGSCHRSCLHIALDTINNPCYTLSTPLGVEGRCKAGVVATDIMPTPAGTTSLSPNVSAR